MVCPHVNRICFCLSFNIKSKTHTQILCMSKIQTAKMDCWKLINMMEKNKKTHSAVVKIDCFIVTRVECGYILMINQLFSCPSNYYCTYPPIPRPSTVSIHYVVCAIVSYYPCPNSNIIKKIIFDRNSHCMYRCSESSMVITMKKKQNLYKSKTKFRRYDSQVSSKAWADGLLAIGETLQQ